MKRLMVLAMALATACSGSKTCDDAFPGQDCGPTLNVTLRYVLDGGSIVLANDAGCGPIATCNVTKQMSAAQFYYAVAPAYRGTCVILDQSGTNRGIVCTHESDIDAGPCLFASGSCLCPSLPVGAFAHECVWQPPLLIP
jgi:hypothetical protein